MSNSSGRRGYRVVGIWGVVGFALVLAVAAVVRAVGPQVEPERAAHARKMGWDAVAYQNVFTLMERAEKSKTLSPDDWSGLRQVLAKGEAAMRIEALAVLPLLRKGDLAQAARDEARSYLNDADPKIRAHALEALCFLRDPSWKSEAKRLRADSSPEMTSMLELLEGKERDGR